MKLCIKCNTNKNLNQFQTGRNQCSECRKLYVRTYQEQHKKDKSVYDNKITIGKRVRTWNAENKNRVRQRKRERYTNDPQFRFKHQTRGFIRHAIKAHGGKKENTTFNLLGCSFGHLKNHLESLWQPRMSWENYGVYRLGESMTWHIDHIRPCASFDLTDPEQQRKCFHWSNLQPLWAIDNLIKSAKWEGS